jgi:hypothetical protein
LEEAVEMEGAVVVGEEWISYSEMELEKANASSMLKRFTFVKYSL